MKILENKRKDSQDKIKIFEEDEESEKVPTLRRQIMYVTQLNRLSPKFLKSDGTFDSNALEDTLRESLKPEDGYKWAFIVHDLDRLSDGSPKPPHLHLILYRQKGIQMKYLYEVLDDNTKANYEYGRSYKAFELYIIHDTERAKLDEKHLYDEHTVVANYDYVAQIEKYRKQRDQAQSKRRQTDYVAKILNGEMYMSDFTSYETEEEQIRATYYATHKKKIDDAFAVKAKIDRQREQCKLLGEYKEDRLRIEKNNDEKKIIWLYGQSGTGKSLFSRLIAKMFSERADEIYFSSSKNDVFQDYTNERIIVLEELRPDAIDVEDLFRLFDRTINVSIKRRYHNVNICADVIIINSILSPVQFYARKFDRTCNVYDKNEVANALLKADYAGEPAMQLLRRISNTVKMVEQQAQSLLFETKALKAHEDVSTLTQRPKVIYSYSTITKLMILVDSKFKNVLKKEHYRDDSILPF